MDTGVLIVAITALTGFVFAGGLLEAIGSFSDERIGFDLLLRHGRKGWLAAPLLFLAGPAIMLRDTIARFLTEGWRSGIAYVGAAIAVAWGLAAGHVLLRVIDWAQPMMPFARVAMLQ